MTCERHLCSRSWNAQQKLRHWIEERNSTCNPREILFAALILASKRPIIIFALDLCAVASNYANVILCTQAKFTHPFSNKRIRTARVY